ncbi:HupE/UreJ protein [Alteromonadaceae bacterium 2753L.S.0a.02]|nr:HupE/UreJ protein [Alteromonadaceae bacterium 2753L.S.0a.02]
MNVPRVFRVLWIVIGCNLWCVRALAHETPIALLEIHQRTATVFQLDWTFSSSRYMSPPTPRFPPHCQLSFPNLDCGDDGLVGEFGFLELGEKYSAAVVRITRFDDKGQRKTESYTLTGANSSINLLPSGKMSLGQVAGSYIPLGFEHIMLGVDHLLFVMGLMLLVRQRWMLFKTITAFTVAHSFTLAAVTMGWLGVPEKPVNSLIALSIVMLAVEVMKNRSGHQALSARFPWMIAFGFGLLHGFGFAGALTGIGLPPENLPSALLFFNVGVEFGQVVFVLLVLAVYYCNRVLEVKLPNWCSTASIYAMGAIASFWFISRLALIVNP